MGTQNDVLKIKPEPFFFLTSCHPNWCFIFKKTKKYKSAYISNIVYKPIKDRNACSSRMYIAPSERKPFACCLGEYYCFCTVKRNQYLDAEQVDNILFYDAIHSSPCEPFHLFVTAVIQPFVLGKEKQISKNHIAEIFLLQLFIVLRGIRSAVSPQCAQPGTALNKAEEFKCSRKAVTGLTLGQCS